MTSLTRRRCRTIPPHSVQSATAGTAAGSGPRPGRRVHAESRVRHQLSASARTAAHGRRTLLAAGQCSQSGTRRTRGGFWTVVTRPSINQVGSGGSGRTRFVTGVTVLQRSPRADSGRRGDPLSSPHPDPGPAAVDRSHSRCRRFHSR